VENLDEIINVITNSNEKFTITGNAKIISGDNYHKLCQLLKIPNKKDRIKTYRALSKVINDNPKIFRNCGITTSKTKAFSECMCYYNGRLVIFDPN